ncbi:MAG: FAD-dependent monooxygenase [Burkholderiaceae bacterium]
MRSEPMPEFDVAVVGGGVAGLATALGCAQQGLRVALLGPRPALRTATEPAPYDLRIYAVAPASVALLERLGVWGRIDLARVEPVLRMRVFAGNEDREAELSFDAYGAQVERLATIVEESELLRVLDAACDFQPAIARLEARFEALATDRSGATVRLADGNGLRARLVVGADGGNSGVRAAAGIRSDLKPYGQTAIVSNFACERPHLGAAWQWFTPEGITALLPLPGQRVSLVWSAPETLAARLAQLSPSELAARVTLRSHAVLGELSPLGPAAGFPLRLMTVQRVVGERLVLVGDAAHIVHPLAGQGLNLGLQDVADLLRVLREREAFRELGDTVLLRRYERARAEPVALMRATTDGLARLFAIDDAVVDRVRGLGFSIANRLAPLKRALIRQALG